MVIVSNGLNLPSHHFISHSWYASAIYGLRLGSVLTVSLYEIFNDKSGFLHSTLIAKLEKILAACSLVRLVYGQNSSTELNLVSSYAYKNASDGLNSGSVVIVSESIMITPVLAVWQYQSVIDGLKISSGSRTTTFQVSILHEVGCEEDDDPPHPNDGVTLTGTAGPDGSIITALTRPSSSASQPSLILNVTLVTGVHHTVLDHILTATTWPISV